MLFKLQSFAVPQANIKRGYLRICICQKVWLSGARRRAALEALIRANVLPRSANIDNIDIAYRYGIYKVYYRPDYNSPYYIIAHFSHLAPKSPS